MICLLYTELSNRLPPRTLDTYLRQLPAFITERILRFKNWQDLYRSLFGNLLLLKGLEAFRLKHHTLEELTYTEFRKPYFPNLFDFNISHAGAYVICAISQENRVGIDVEHIKEMPLCDFETNFSTREWEIILESDNILRAFYKHWTQKEAFLKAIGMGLNLPLEEISFANQKIVWENASWFSHEIILDREYVCHLVTNTSQPKIRLEKIDFSAGLA